VAPAAPAKTTRNRIRILFMEKYSKGWLLELSKEDF